MVMSVEGQDQCPCTFFRKYIGIRYSYYAANAGVGEEQVGMIG